MTLFCKDCVYFQPVRINCTHPVNQDSVTGGIRDISCYFMRDEEGSCRPEGRLFVRADKTPPLPPERITA